MSLPYYNKNQNEEKIEINDQTRLEELTLVHRVTCEEETCGQGCVCL